MPLIPAERDWLASQEATRIQFMSLHTGDPGTTGANEAAGVARKAVVFGAPSNGPVTAAEVAFDVNAGVFTHFGWQTAATGGIFRGGNPLASTQTHTGTGNQVKVVGSVPVTTS